MTKSSVNLNSLDVEGLLALRAQIDEQLLDRRRDLQRQLARLGGGETRAGGRGHAMKGVKVAPKYRGPGGETWAGRGAQPRWLTSLLKEGHTLEEFAIDKSSLASARKTPSTKRRGRRKAA